jgi:hypothetical protein
MPAKCLGCSRSLTWEERRRQYGRAIKAYGLTPEQAAACTPRCQKCTTELLSSRRAEQRFRPPAGQSSQ